MMNQPPLADATTTALPTSTAPTAPANSSAALPNLNAADTSAVIAMAWADEVSFAAIKLQYGLTEAQIITLMRRELKRSSFRLWRARVTGRHAKHPQREIAKQRWAQAIADEN